MPRARRTSAEFHRDIAGHDRAEFDRHLAREPEMTEREENAPDCRCGHGLYLHQTTGPCMGCECDQYRVLSVAPVAALERKDRAA